MLKDSVKCKKAMDAGLCSANLRHFYIPCLRLFSSWDKLSQCKCCENADLVPDLVRIENPLFLVFLRDKGSKNERAYQLHWKYLLFRDKRIEAIEVIVNLCEQSDLSFQTKVDLLETALTISSGIDYKIPDDKIYLHGRIRLMLRLSKIQIELVERDPSVKTNQLLNAETLFNDYCYEHSDLGIKVLDAVGFGDKKVLRDLYAKYFHDKSLSQCLAFVREIGNKSLELIIDLLVEKLGDSNANDARKFCEKLSRAGFNHKDVNRSAMPLKASGTP